MLSDELPAHIRSLVDHLRENQSATMSLTEIASVTEVLIATTSAFFRSVDTSVYQEFRSLSDYIVNARKEIASLQPGDLESDRIPRAGLELDAIVRQTEDATNTIMESAEAIMGADINDIEAYQATVNDAVMEIFQACSFQDITGQRISKVVSTLQHIETRVLELRSLLGVTEEDMDEARVNEQDEKESGDRALLQGPALEGEGINQTEVDALIGNEDAHPSNKVVESAKAPDVPAQAPSPSPAKAKAPAPPPPAPKAVDKKQLDSMFEEDFDPVADLKKQEDDKAQKKAKADKAEANMAAGEEVSQDDIDALFN